MRNAVLELAVAAGITLCASGASAQKANGSDVTGPPSITIAGGAFSPLPVPSAGGASGGRAGGGASAGPAGAGASAVASTGASFTSGASVTSPATGQPVAPAAVAAVGSLISGGSPASVAAVGVSLQNGGASASSVAPLMQAMAALANASPAGAPAAIGNAAKAFNALVADAPPGFFTSNNGGPPATFLAIHAALTRMTSALGH